MFCINNLLQKLQLAKLRDEFWKMEFLLILSHLGTFGESTMLRWI